MVTTNISFSRKLSNLTKIYGNNAKCCCCNDSFTFKLAIFHDICLKADVSPKLKMKVFSTMFKDIALDYHYSNINISAIAINFD